MKNKSKSDKKSYENKNFIINKWILGIAFLAFIVGLITLILTISFQNKDEKLEKGFFKVISMTTKYNYLNSGRAPQKNECPQCPSIEVWIQNQSKLDQVFDHLLIVHEKDERLSTRDGVSLNGKLFLPRFSTNFSWASNCEQLKILFDKKPTELILENQYGVKFSISDIELKKIVSDFKQKYQQYQSDLKKYYTVFPNSN